MILSDSGRTEEAHAYKNKAFAVMDTIDDPYEEAKVKSSAAAIYIRENYPKAIEMYYYALNVLRSIGVREELVTIYRELSEVYETAGQPDSALSAWRSYVTLRDSLVNEDVLEHQRNLEAMYESEKKEQSTESRAVRNSTGMSLPALRMPCNTCHPSMPGNMTSSTAKS